MKTRSKNAFTLLELIVVMAIIAVLAGLFMTSYPASQRRARDTQRRNDIRQYQTALEIYAGTHSDLYPIYGTVTNMATVCSGASLRVSQCIDDPNTSKHYRYISEGAGLRYVLWAEMEQKNDSGVVVYYIGCSNGLVGTSTTAPTTSTCPAL